MATNNNDIIWDDEEDIVWDDAKPKAPATPYTATEGPQTETVIRHGWDAGKPSPTEGIELPQNVKDYYLSALNDFDIPLGEININMRRMLADQGRAGEFGGEIFDPAAAEAAREASRLSGKPIQGAIQYESGIRTLEGLRPEVLENPEERSDVGLMAEEGLLFNPMNVIENWRKDITDADINSSINKENIAQAFPDASEEQIEEIHDSLIGDDLRRQRTAVSRELDNRSTGLGFEAARMAIGLPTGASPADLIPFAGRGANLAMRGMGAVASNQAIDAAMQAGDISYGAQDRFSNTQNLFAGLAGAGFHAGLEGIGYGVRRVLSKGVDSRGVYIEVVTNEGETKKVYRGEEGAVEDVQPKEGSALEGQEVPEFLKRPVKAKGYDGKPKGKSEPRVVGTDARDAAARVEQVAGQWKNAPDFLIVNNVDDLDPKLEAEITADAAEGALGVTLPDGRVLLLTDNIKTPEALDGVIYHEALGHYGLHQEYGEGLADLLTRMDDSNEALRADVDAWIEKNGWEGDRHVAVEEVLAELSERGEIDGSILNSIKAFLARLAAKAGYTKKNFSDADVIEILRQGQQRVIAGERNAATLPGMRYIRAWHTSPAKFDEFDDAYMGTGQGAQAFSWGHYFSQGNNTRNSYFSEFKRDAEVRAAREINRRRSSAPPLVDPSNNSPVLKRTNEFGKTRSDKTLNPEAFGPNALKADQAYNVVNLIKEGTWADLNTEVLLRFPGLGRKWARGKIFSDEEAKTLLEPLEKGDMEQYELTLAQMRRDVFDAIEDKATEGRKAEPSGVFRQNFMGDITKEDFALLSREGKKLSREMSELLNKYEILQDLGEDGFARNYPDTSDIDDSPYTYEVELPDEDWLDWDLPMEKQPNVVKKAFKDLEKDFPDKAPKGDKERAKFQKEKEEALQELDEIQRDIDEVEHLISKSDDEDYIDLRTEDLETLQEYKNEALEELENAEFNLRILDDWKADGDVILTGERAYYEAARTYFNGNEKALSKYLHEKGVPGTAFLDHDNRGTDLDGLSDWEANRIKTENDHYDQRQEAFERALSAYTRNRAKTVEKLKNATESEAEFLEKDIEYYDKQLEITQRRLDRNDTERAKALEDIQRLAWRNQTRNLVAYDPENIKVVNRFRTKDGVPDNETYTDLYQDSDYVDSSAGNRYMRDTERTPSKLKLNPGKQKQRGMIGNVSGNRFKSKQAVHPIIKEAAELAPELTRDSFAEMDRRARAVDVDLEDIANKGLKPEEAHAVGVALITKSEQVTRLAKVIDSGDASDYQMTKFMESFLELSSIYETYAQIANDAGRLLASFKIAKQSSSNSALRFMAEDTTRAMGQLPAGAETEGPVRALAKAMSNGETSPSKTVKASPSVSALSNALNLPRTLMSSADLSASLRQAIVLSTTKNFWKNFFQMFRYIGSQDAFDAIQHNIINDPNYLKMREAGVDFTTTEGKHAANLEEDFQSEWGKGKWAKRLGIGHVVAGSERAFVGFLNKLRADTFNQYMRDWEKAGIDTNDPKLLRWTGDFINAATGRGPMPKKYLGATPLLNGLFFSPRLNTSRMALLSPYYLAAPAPVRKAYVRNMTGFMGLAFTTIALASIGGADVETDPRSSDFGKIRVGTRRYDVLGGFGQFITLYARMATGETKTIKGDVKELNSGDFGSDTRLDVAARFARNKASPVTSFFLDAADGQNSIGERFTLTEPLTAPPEGEDPVEWNKNAIVTRMVPIYLQDVFEAIQQDGPLGAAWTIPAVFGIGYSDFESVPSDSPLREENNPDSPVVQEVMRLAAASGKNPFGNASRRVNLEGDGQGARNMTDEEWERYQQIADQYILEDVGGLIQSEDYMNASDEEKAEMMNKLVKQSRKDARATLADEFFGDGAITWDE